MERFALAAAVVLGFALTAALCSLFVPLRRVLERREQNQQPVQSEQPRPAPLRAPLWGGLCAAAGTVAAVGVGWLAACVGQPELLGSAAGALRRYGLCYILLGSNILMGGFLTAVERPKAAISISVGRGLAFQAGALLLFGDGACCGGPIEAMLQADVLGRLYQHDIRRVGDGVDAVFVPA